MILCFLGFGCGGGGETTSAPASLPASVPESASVPVVEEPPKDPKAACLAPLRQASMFLTFTKTKGIEIEAPIPRDAGVVTGDKVSGPGARSLLFTVGKKEYGLRYSFPDNSKIPLAAGDRVKLKRVRTRCTVGTTDGWRVENEKGLVALVEVGGCAPAWPEEVLPGLVIRPEDVGCAPKGEESFERACALKVISPEGEALLGPGESKEVSLAQGRFQVSAGLCALSLKDAALFKGKPSREKEEASESPPKKKLRENAAHRLSYAVLRRE